MQKTKYCFKSLCEIGKHYKQIYAIHSEENTPEFFSSGSNGKS